ncbi:MAG: BON domain-containing protein [Candidatus Acidiferrum sp.]
MKIKLRAIFLAALFAAPLATPANIAATTLQNSPAQNEPKAQQQIIREVHHVLVMLPYYSVFDNLAYRVEGDKVTLEGQVVRPTLKTDAGAAVKKIDGVSSVVNNIEVLPLSPMDDQTRRAVYRAIYGDSVLSRYGFSAVPSIHIIVKLGSVTLEGVVDNESDKNLANLRASEVPNVFSVKNNLQVASSGK